MKAPSEVFSRVFGAASPKWRAPTGVDLRATEERTEENKERRTSCKADAIFLVLLLFNTICIYEKQKRKNTYCSIYIKITKQRSPIQQ